MANIVVTKQGNSVSVDFGVYSSIANIQKSSYYVNAIELVQLVSDQSHVQVYVNAIELVQLVSDQSHVQVYVKIENTLWFLTFDQNYTGQDYFIVDSIDGVQPTSNEHLYNLISNLR